MAKVKTKISKNFKIGATLQAKGYDLATDMGKEHSTITASRSSFGLLRKRREPLKKFLGFLWQLKDKREFIGYVQACHGDSRWHIAVHGMHNMKEMEVLGKWLSKEVQLPVVVELETTETKYERTRY